MSAICDDCGMDTEPWPPRRGTQEHYVVKHSVWQQAGMPSGVMDPDEHLAIRGGGVLCVGCIERRLGRMLTTDDFVSGTLEFIKGCQSTPRLLSRIGVAAFAVAHQPLPDHVVDRWLATTIKNALREQDPSVKKVEVDGDEVILIDKEQALRCRAGPEVMALRDAMRWHRERELGDGIIDLLPWE
jgi:hypothetical protein